MTRTKKAWRKGKGGGGQAQDLTSCRGYGIFLGTCNAARERETSNELVNLINDIAEELYPVEDGDEGEAQGSEKLSMAELIRREVEAVKDTSSKKAIQRAVSINTGVKGIVMIRLTNRVHCPVRILEHVMQRIITEKRPLTRHIVRLIPLQSTFFPNEDEFREHARKLVEDREFDAPSSKRQKVETSEDAEEKTKSILYSVEFKARNHKVLTRDLAFRVFNALLHERGRVDYMNPEAVIHIEALKNIAGMSWIQDPAAFHDFNIRQLQEKVCGQSDRADEAKSEESTSDAEDEEKVDEDEEDS